MFDGHYPILKLCMLITMYLCVLCGFQNKQYLLPYTSLTYWFFITEAETVYSAVRTASLYNSNAFGTWRVKLITLLLSSKSSSQLQKSLISSAARVTDPSATQSRCFIYTKWPQLRCWTDYDVTRNGRVGRNHYPVNTLNAELNPICCLLALLAHHFLHVSRIRVKSLTLRLLMSYIYGAHILDVSRSHTPT